jgi:hypothetical protein
VQTAIQLHIKIATAIQLAVPRRSNAIDYWLTVFFVGDKNCLFLGDGSLTSSDVTIPDHARLLR